MARLHTRGHGKSKSRKPILAEARVDANKEKTEEAILSYVKQGMSGALIGLNLKEKHGAGYLKPILGKRLNQFLLEKGIKKEIPDDLMDLMREAVNMRRHLSVNRRDTYGKMRLQRVESKIWRLSKYYTRTGKLPADWRYDPEQAALMTKKA